THADAHERLACQHLAGAREVRVGRLGFHGGDKGAAVGVKCPRIAHRAADESEDTCEETRKEARHASPHSSLQDAAVLRGLFLPRAFQHRYMTIARTTRLTNKQTSASVAPAGLRIGITG